VDYSDVLKLPSNVAKGIKTVGVHVDFYGLCKNCQKSERG